MIKITSLRHLERILREAPDQRGDFIMQLAGGTAVSRKTVCLDNGDNKWEVINHIDDSIGEWDNDRELANNTHIPLAIERGAFYYEED